MGQREVRPVGAAPSIWGRSLAVGLSIGISVTGLSAQSPVAAEGNGGSRQTPWLACSYVDGVRTKPRSCEQGPGPHGNGFRRARWVKWNGSTAVGKAEVRKRNGDWVPSVIRLSDPKFFSPTGDAPLPHAGWVYTVVRISPTLPNTRSAYLVARDGKQCATVDRRGYLFWWKRTADGSGFDGGFGRALPVWEGRFAPSKWVNGDLNSREGRRVTGAAVRLGWRLDKVRIATRVRSELKRSPWMHQVGWRGYAAKAGCPADW